MMIIIWFIDRLCSNFSLTSVLLEMKWTSNAPPNSFEARVWITTTPANTNELFVCQKAESVFFLISASPDKKGTSCYSNWTLTLGRQCRVLVRWLVSASVIKASSKLIIRWHGATPKPTKEIVGVFYFWTYSLWLEKQTEWPKSDFLPA